MKRIVAIITSLVIVFCVFGITASADAILYGDANGDGNINTRDAALVMQYANGWIVNVNISNADVNIDYKINTRDYALIMQYANGWDIKLGEKQPDAINPEDYKGTAVVMATTVLAKANGTDYVFNSFEKEYGIKVNEILIYDNMYEVGNKIAAGVNVDVVKCNGDFPAVLSVLQPLTKAKLDYNDPMWDKNMFKFSSINEVPYLCNTIGNIWAENACVLYSKSLLKQAQCYTPEEYDALDKWTWEAFFETAKHVDLLDGKIGIDSNIHGCYISVEDMLGSVGCGVYDYENGKFSNGLKNTFHKEAILKLANLYRDGSASSSATYDTVRTFFNGKVGICIANIQMLKKFEASSGNIDWSDIGFYKMPSYDSQYQANDTSRVIGWGICKGSENPVGAGIFLRYYLDVNNYDVDNLFISTEATDFFFKVTNFDYNTYTPYFTYEYSTNTISGFDEYNWEELTRLPTEYINRDYPIVSAEVDSACNNLNKFVEQYTQ